MTECPQPGITLLILMTRRMSDSQRRMLQEEGRLQALLYQGFASIESFRASGTEDVFFRRWAGAHAKFISAEQAMMRWRRLLNNLVVALTAVTGIGVVLVGGMRVMEGTVTIGMLVAFQTLMSNFKACRATLGGLVLQDRRRASRRQGHGRRPHEPVAAADMPKRTRSFSSMVRVCGITRLRIGKSRTSMSAVTNVPELILRLGPREDDQR
jgi:ABC-type multidrug transport system fused ATPase/permease subunit